MTVTPEEIVEVFETSSAPPERVKFGLKVTHNKTGAEAIHQFDIPGRLSAGAQLWLAQFAPNDTGETIADAGIIMGFFQRVIPPEDFGRFARIVDHPEYSVELPYLGKLLDHVVFKITGRRPTRQGASSGVASFDGQSWTAPPSSAGATSQPSPQPGI